MGAIFVLAMFSALWGVAGLAYAGASPILFVTPIVTSATLFLFVRRRLAGAAKRTPEDARRAGRLIMIWSAVEGFAIFIAINIVGTLHRPILAMAAVCAVVGLHFFPLARGLPKTSYYVTGGALTALALAGLIAPDAATPARIGLGAASILWLTIAFMIPRRPSFEQPLPVTTEL